MSIVNWFKSVKTKIVQTMSRWKELGSFTARFSKFNGDVYASDLVRSCIRPLAELSSKANAVCFGQRGKEYEYLLNVRPNPYMSAKDFLYKVRTHLEIKNTAFVLINRDDKGKATGLYPIPYSAFEGWEYKGRLYIKFFFKGEAARELVAPWSDLAVLRKDYNESDIAGDGNEAIIPLLELVSTSNQGIANAVKATANLRGIIKSTKSMLSPEDTKKQRDQFVEDYLNLENEGGIASLDSTQEFTPITMNPVVTNAEQLKEFRENVYRYFGVNDAIVKSDYTEAQLESFIDARIEPFLIALSQELTFKLFTERELGFGNGIIYESKKIQYASLNTQISIYKEVVLYGGMTINEWREGCNMAPVSWGDKPIMRKDAGFTEDTTPEGNEDE